MGLSRTYKMPLITKRLKIYHCFHPAFVPLSLHLINHKECNHFPIFITFTTSPNMTSFSGTKVFFILSIFVQSGDVNAACKNNTVVCFAFIKSTTRARQGFRVFLRRLS